MFLERGKLISVNRIELFLQFSFSNHLLFFSCIPKAIEHVCKFVSKNPADKGLCTAFAEEKKYNNYR